MSSAHVDFDPNAVGNKQSGIFGLPFDSDSAETVIVAVPWDVTTSYQSGAHKGPQAILDASYQVDLYHPDFPYAWEQGIAIEPISEEWLDCNQQYREKAEAIIEALEQGEPLSESLMTLQQDINAQSEKLNQWVEAQTSFWLEKGKRVGLLGGEHSVPLGFLRALSNRYPNFGILHIDAHMDLRESYEGFTYSHASIMRHAAGLKSVSRLVQVGIRDYCEEEWAFSLDSKGKIKVFTDKELKEHLFTGKSFESICKKIIHALPDWVYISVDIDGLDPALCPGTGTPVPGGLSYEQLSYLLAMLSKSKKKIIGFDLVEVAPQAGSQWDANVGARVLYQLFGYASLTSS